MRFKDYLDLSESIYAEGDKLVIDYFQNDTGIKTAFGKNKKLDPYEKKIGDTISYSLYNVGSAPAALLKMIKKDDFIFSDAGKHFIKRSAIYASKVLRPKKIDVVVSPLSSSKLTEQFLIELGSRNNYDIYPNMFVKQPDISKIRIDKDHPSISPKIITKLEKTLERAQRKGKLSLQTDIFVRDRKFILNMFDVLDKKLLEKVDGKNVLIADDILTSGTTMINIIDVLKAHGAKDVIGLTIFKSQK
jgi:hypothetical protein